MKQRFVLSILALLLTFAGVSAGQRIGQWEKIGERSVDFKLDRDEIRCSSRKIYSKLKINVKGAPIKFERVMVEFANGGRQELQLRDVIPAGGSSRELDLRGNKRVIKRIILYYHTQRGAKKAKISIWGRH